MTFGDLLALVWRHRVVAAICLVLTGVAVCVASAPVDAWNGRVSVVLLLPKQTTGNAIASTTRSLIATAGVVARAANGPGEPPQTVSSELDLSSVGVVRGWSVRQPNAGGQWDVNYEEARLDVKSTGRTQEEASEEMSEALAAITQSLESLQDAQSVPETQRIRVQLSPIQPVFTVQSGSHARAMASILAAGVGMTLTAVVAADRLARRRRSALGLSSSSETGPCEMAGSGSRSSA